MLFLGYLGTITIPVSEIMKGPIVLAQNNSRILQYIKDAGLVKEPSTREYNLLTEEHYNPSMGQGQYIQTLFLNKVKECLGRKSLNCNYW